MPTRIVILVVVLIVFLVFRRQILAMFLLSSAGKGALRDIGAQAVAVQPDVIRLDRLVNIQWREPEKIEPILSDFKFNGFRLAGVYAVDKMPGVRVALLAGEELSISAQVYEHPKAESWIEMVTYYEDGSSTTISTMPDKGMNRPAWITTILVPGATPKELIQRLTRERKHADMRAVTTANIVALFEEGYARYMLWRKNNAMTAEEVAATVKRWAAK